jgi:hypothetical protein
MTDILESLAEYAPRGDAEWNLARQDSVLQSILGRPSEAPAGVEIPLQLQFRPPRRRRRVSALVASAAALTAAASAIVAITLHGGGGGQMLAVGAAWDPPAGLSDQAPIDTGKYSLLTIDQIQLDAGGNPVADARASMTDRSYIAPNGTITSTRTGSQNGCFDFKDDRPGNFERPTEAFLAGLPTDVGALETYLRSHVSGSSSLDEAVFVAVGDVLRTGTDLASPKLKAAMLAVLSRTGGVVLHDGVQDYLGRPAIRADFVNQAIRPGVVESLFFDPTTFAMVEQGDLSNGQPTNYNGPSPAYTSHAGPGVDPDQLGGPGFVSVVTHDSIVDSMPGCPK